MSKNLKGTFGTIKIINDTTVEKIANQKKNNKINQEANISKLSNFLIKKYNIALTIPRIYSISKHSFVMDRIYPAKGNTKITTCIFWRFEDINYQEDWDTIKLNNLYENNQKYLNRFSYNLGLMHCVLINNGVVPWEMEIIYGHLLNQEDQLFCCDFDKWGTIDEEDKYTCRIKGFNKLELYNLLIQECYPLPIDKNNWDNFCNGMLDFTNKFGTKYSSDDISKMIELASIKFRKQLKHFSKSYKE